MLAETPPNWLPEVQTPPKDFHDTPVAHSLLTNANGKIITTVEEWEKRKTELREAWIQHLGSMASVRKKDQYYAPPKIEVLETFDGGDYLRKKILYETEPGQSVRAYLMVPKEIKTSRPAVVIFHGTNENSYHQTAGVFVQNERAAGLHLVKRGYITLCPQNSLWHCSDEVHLKYKEVSAEFRKRNPNQWGMARMILDAQVAVDILVSMKEVDPKRIGTTGHSLGAKQALYLPAFDERVYCSVSSEGGIGFEQTNWDADWYLGPDVKNLDFPLNHREIVAMIAPRPFLVLGGDASDGDASWQYIAAALPVYRLYGEPARIGLFNHRKGHSVPPEAEEKTYQWFEAFLSEPNDAWTPPRVPTTGAVPFILYYQQFLRERPFAIETFQQSPEIAVENRRRHWKSANLYAAMAEVASRLAESDDLLPAAPEDIEKKDTERIKGSWNLYPDVPINAADLRQEALYMRYTALSHETSLAPMKIVALHNFVAGLEKEADMLKLFQKLKRDTCARALSFAYNPLKKHRDEPDIALPNEENIAKKLSVAIQWFVPFLQKYPTEDNLKYVGSFLETIDLFRACFPDSDRLPDFVEPFRSVFADIQSQQVEPLIREYAEIYEGVLRRWNLLGEMMPLWGADLSGNRLDENTLDGKVVLLDFWATWCGPCIAEFPHLKRLYQKYKNKGFEIVGYSVDADQERLRDYLARNPLPWIVLSQESTRRSGLPSLSHHYGAKSLPVVLLRDRSGKTLLLDARGQKLDEVLEELFE